MEMTLRGLVFGKYRSIIEFADAIGWSRNKASAIVNGNREPSKKDMEAIIAEFGIPAASVATVFFGAMFTE